jgi:predicted kinase
VVETPPTCRPLLTIVSGRPGSGKTTLARAIAQAIRCPLISRDEIKEGLVNSGLAHSDATQRLANEIFFDTIEQLVRRGVTLIAEAAFQHKLWAPRLEPLLTVTKTRIILCVANPELARSRHIQRGLNDPQRERFHGDYEVRAAREGRQMPIGDYVPPKFEVPALEVDTTDGYTPPFARIVAFTDGTSEPKRARG